MLKKMRKMQYMNVFNWQCHNSNYMCACQDGLSKVDLELARCRRLLEVAYQNDHDAGYTYINKSGTDNSFPLTPFMMKEWARAIVCVLLYSHEYR
jgi:hypothetical protein